MIEVGRLCVKIAGRDAGLKCVVVDILDDKFALIDGETRRRKCNVMHLEPLKETIKIKKKASHEEVKKEFDKLGLTVRETKPKDKTERPKKQVKKKEVKQEKKKEKKAKVKKEKSKTKEGQSLEEKAGLKEEKKEEKKETEPKKK